MNKEKLFQFINKQIKEYAVHGINTGQDPVGTCEICDLPTSACNCGREKVSDAHRIARVSNMKILKEDFSKVHFNSHKKLNESTSVDYTKLWRGLTPEKKKQLLATNLGKDAENIEKYLDLDWSNLPPVAQKNLEGEFRTKLNEEVDSNLVIKWRQPSPSAIAYFKKIGLNGKNYQEAEIEKANGNEVWYVKLDGKKYEVNVDHNNYKEVNEAMQKICKDCQLPKNECICKEAKKITERIIKGLKEDMRGFDPGSSNYRLKDDNSKYEKILSKYLNNTKVTIQSVKKLDSGGAIIKANTEDGPMTFGLDKLNRVMTTGVGHSKQNEVAPPGMEKNVRAMKKEFPKGSASPFKIAWSQYNKGK